MPSNAARRRQFSRHIALLVLASAALYLVGNSSVPLWDRDEPRYAQTSRQMLQSGDWIVPRFLDEVRTAKPVLIYWCQAGAMWLLGQDSAFAARASSVVAMILTLLMLARTLPNAIGRRRTVWTIFILATAGLTIASAKMCLTDAVLLLWVTIAQLCYYEILRGRGSWRAWSLLGGAIGFAGLTKGPVVLGVMLSTAVVLVVLQWYDTGRLQLRGFDLSSAAKLLICLLIVFAICAPWLIAIQLREPQFLRTILGHDVLKRVTSGLEGHKGPPGYYLLTIWGTFFPWSLFLPATMVHAWKHRRDPAIRFALAAVVGPWVMFEIVQTKLPHYLLPVFPPLAFLTARMLFAEGRRGKDGRIGNRPFVLVAAAWCTLVALAAAAPFVVTWLTQEAGVVALLVSVAVAIVGFEYARSVLVSFRAGKPVYAAAVMGVGMMLLVALLYGAWLPRIPAIRLSTRVADVLRAEGATQPGDAIMIDFKEPSLAFYQGGTIREESRNNYLTEETRTAFWPPWIVMTRRIWDGLPHQVQSKWDVVAGERGWWYASKGRPVEVLVIRKRYSAGPLEIDADHAKMPTHP